MATVDILLPVKNAAPYLAESIGSVLDQTWQDWRLLVLDHGSDDGSAELAQRFAERDRRIEVHRFAHAAGLSGLLNAGLALCDCRYVMRHDADDVCLPRRFERTMAGFEAHPGAAVIGGHHVMMDRGGALLGLQRLPVGTTRLAVASLFRNPFSHPTVMMDWPRLERLGMRYGADFSGVLPAAHSLQVEGLVEDYFLFGQLAALGLCANIDEPMIRYRWYAGNVTNASRGEQTARALAVSRFLVRLASARHGIAYVDPAPLCNHGFRLFDTGQLDYDSQFEALAAGLRQAYGASAELERELAWRRVLTNRRLGPMAARYACFRRRHAPESGEWLSVRSWMLRRLPGRALPVAQVAQ